MNAVAPTMLSSSKVPQPEFACWWPSTPSAASSAAYSPRFSPFMIRCCQSMLTCTLSIPCARSLWITWSVMPMLRIRIFIAMTLHVIHKLRAQGIDNVQVNMDWQHLLMNGENLAEYAAMLAGEGLLGHQHANSGWGTFDDDNMVGATAFMETLELALELRRAGYGDSGERLGFDLYPYTEDALAAVRRSVLQWRFIDSVAARIDDAALREAQSHKDAIKAYEIVYKALGA